MEISPCAALSRDDKEKWSLEMTNKVLTFNKLYHDKERNRKIHRATFRGHITPGGFFVLIDLSVSLRDYQT